MVVLLHDEYKRNRLFRPKIRESQVGQVEWSFSSHRNALTASNGLYREMVQKHAQRFRPFEEQLWKTGQTFSSVYQYII